MIRRLRLIDFKSFRDAELRLGPITTVIGANATGKSNLRDAFRFLHGIGRGYTLAEILGGRFGEGGYREWNGIRGGVREAARFGSAAFELEVEISNRETPSRDPGNLVYRLRVENLGPIYGPRVVEERLSRRRLPTFVLGNGKRDNPSHERYTLLFESGGVAAANRTKPLETLAASFGDGSSRKRGPCLKGSSDRPFLGQLADLANAEGLQTRLRNAIDGAAELMDAFRSMRFVDLVPDAMRLASTPGQTALTDQGENLSSVLQAMCLDPGEKAALISRLEELTPMEVSDLDFVEDGQGKVQVRIIDRAGGRTSVHSASDGTLRFLGLVAALSGPQRAKFFFLEELDNGIHPVRMHLLFNFIEKQTRDGGVQVFTTTHSPQWLRFMSPKRLSDVSLAYRVEGVPETRLKALDQIESLNELARTKDIARLYEGGWMEDSVSFAEAKPEPLTFAEDEAGTEDGASGKKPS